MLKAWCDPAFLVPRIDPHWARDIFDALLTEIFEGAIEPIAHLIANYPAEAYPAGLSQRLQPCRHVHPIAEDVVFFNDYVAEVDADAEPDAPLLGHLGLSVGHPALDLDGTADCINHTGKLRQEAVPGVLYDPAPVVCDLGIYQLAEMCLQALMRPFFILAHQTRIARHIGG